MISESDVSNSNPDGCDLLKNKNKLHPTHILRLRLKELHVTESVKI
jgi:hypothetical protein